MNIRTFAGAGLRALIIGGMAATAASTVARAAQIDINFDSFPDQTVITNQYASATFHSDHGAVVETTAQPIYTQISQPNFICTFSGGAIDCTEDVFVDFTRPVSGLSFLSTGGNADGPDVANVDVFGKGGLLGSVAIPAIGLFKTAQFIDLSSFHHVTSIEIDQVTDPFGLGYDDFKFTQDPVDRGGIPEPATWVMMVFGFGSLGALLRRRAGDPGRTRSMQVSQVRAPSPSR